MKKIKSLIRLLIFIIPKTVIAFKYDLFRWLRFSLRDSDRITKQQRQAKLLLNLHALEKGLSFPDPREGWGYQKAFLLSKYTHKYITDCGIDDLARLSVGVLDAFINDPLTGKSETLIHNVELLKQIGIEKKDLIGGVKFVQKDLINFNFQELYNVASLRSSVRHYSEKDITSQEIENAVKYAQTAPSVCNRQACKIHVFSDNFNDILDVQLGNKGWAHKANKLFVVTADLNFFGSVYERNQPYIDGGMFAMQFVMGMHVQKIATCCKMYIRKPDLDKKFYIVTDIPKNEIPIMLILAGNYSDEIIKVPHSYRFSSTNRTVNH